jgi:hypothetical protein
MVLFPDCHFSGDNAAVVFTESAARVFGQSATVVVGESAAGEMAELL